jgi:hypothetical protein
VANFGVTGPYFFEEEDGHAVTATSAHHIEMLRNFLTPEMSHRGIELSTIWFQQDSATAHTARVSMEVVRDLSPCDYFLWGYLKAKVYTTRSRTIDDLKIAIRKQISAIPENMARRALGNLLESLEECVRNDGQHFSDVLFKTK